VRKQVLEADADVQGKLAKGFKSVCAFVTFEDPKHRADCINLHKRGLMVWMSK